MSSAAMALRVRRSASEVKGPLVSRAASSWSAPSRDNPFTNISPTRIPSGWPVQRQALAFTQGGRMATPIRRASAT